MARGASDFASDSMRRFACVYIWKFLENGGTVEQTKQFGRERGTDGCRLDRARLLDRNGDGGGVRPLACLGANHRALFRI